MLKQLHRVIELMGTTSYKGILIDLSAINTCGKMAYEIKRNTGVWKDVLSELLKKKSERRN